MLSRSASNVIPNSLNLSTPQFSFHLAFIESASAILFFNKCVFEKFTLRPELFA